MIANQIGKALSNVKNIENIVFAYEPVWSIGTGQLPSCDEIAQMISYIKEYLKTNYNCICKVLYGGSVNEKNIKELKSIQGIDGFLIGGASLDATKFYNLIIA